MQDLFSALIVAVVITVPAIIVVACDVNGYNTGKVVIGCRYEPTKRSHMNSTDIWWQTVLLGRRQTLLERFKLFFKGDM